MKLQDKVAIVTAAAGAGIGKATAFAYAALGADVVVTDIHQGRTEETVSELEAEFGRPFLGLSFDVTDEDAVNAAITEVLEKKGRIDIIVNNAARNLPAPVTQMSTESWYAIMDACLTSQFFSVKSFEGSGFPRPNHFLDVV